MTELSRLGRFFYASSMAGFGIQYLVHTFLGGPIPGPPWSPGRSLWAYATAVLLIATAACIASGRQIRPAAVILAILLMLHAVLAFGPRLVANIHDPGPWTSGFEILAMSGAALVLSGSLGELGRILFAISLVVFGTQHFLYARFVATLVPAWIPGRFFWSVFVGVAFFAAALSIATKKSSGWSTTLLGLMFFLWVFVVHLPRVAASPHDGKEWTSALVALAMCGGAWLMSSGAVLARKR